MVCQTKKLENLATDGRVLVRLRCRLVRPDRVGDPAPRAVDVVAHLDPDEPASELGRAVAMQSCGDPWRNKTLAVVGVCRFIPMRDLTRRIRRELLPWALARKVAGAYSPRAQANARAPILLRSLRGPLHREHPNFSFLLSTTL